MKKSCSIFALVAALLLVAMPAKAADTGDADKAHFGVRLQFDMNTSTKYSHMFHFGPGVSAGINYYAPFGKSPTSTPSSSSATTPSAMRATRRTNTTAATSMAR